MARYSVYTAWISYKPEHRPERKFGVGTESPVYLRRVNADSRLEALNKCLPDLRRELPKVRGKYLAVFVGETANPTAYASRLHPFQLVIETGELRNDKTRIG